jgi:hypothetical protein
MHHGQPDNLGAVHAAGFGHEANERRCPAAGGSPVPGGFERVAQIVGARVERFRAVEVVDQPPGGLGGGADGGVAAVFGAQGMRPLAAEAGGRRQGWMSAVLAGALPATRWSERRIPCYVKGLCAARESNPQPADLSQRSRAMLTRAKNPCHIREYALAIVG